MFKKILLLAFVITLISGILITGCAKTTTTTTTSTPSVVPTTTTAAAPTTTAAATPSATPTTTVKTPTPTAAPTETPQTGGTLRIISGADVTCLGWPAEQFSVDDYYQRVPAIETLVRFDAKNNGPVPFLAEQVIEDSSAKTITFVLRKGIQFQDGTDFDATACKWNLDQLMTGVDTSMDFANVSSIEVVDDNTVRLDLKSWDTVFLRLMCWDSGMVSPTAFEKNGVDWMRNNPVGTGPFKLVSFQRDVKKVFEKWGGYWQKGKPYLDRIEISIVADATVQNASFLSGDADIISLENCTDAANLRGNSSAKLIQSSVEGSLDELIGDSASSNSPFANLKVRQAVSYAIDYQTIHKTIYKDFGLLTNQLAPTGSLTYNPNIVGYPYNPDKARELLKEAGYTNGLDTTIYCSSTLFYQDLYTAVQSYLANVGIKADIKLLGFGQLGEMGMATGWSSGLFTPGLLDDAAIGTIMRYSFAASSGTGIAKSTIHPDDVENALAQMTTAPDSKTKQSAAWELQSLMIDKYCILTPIMFSPNITAWSTKVHDEPYETGPINAPWSFADTWMEK